MPPKKGVTKAQLEQQLHESNQMIERLKARMRGIRDDTDVEYGKRAIARTVLGMIENRFTLEEVRTFCENVIKGRVD
jgi:hypothetical protein